MLLAASATLTALLAQVALCDDVAWNYDNHGDDWTMGSCAKFDGSAPQSPMDIGHNGIDWYSKYISSSDTQFSFLPGFKKTKITDQKVIGYTKHIYG